MNDSINKTSISAESMKYNRIAYSPDQASSGDFIPEGSIIKDYWGDTTDGMLELELLDDGSYEITEDGVIMGYTDKETGDAIIDQVNKSNEVSKSLGSDAAHDEHVAEIRHDRSEAATTPTNNSQQSNGTGSNAVGSTNPTASGSGAISQPISSVQTSSPSANPTNNSQQSNGAGSNVVGSTNPTASGSGVSSQPISSVQTSSTETPSASSAIDASVPSTSSQPITGVQTNPPVMPNNPSSVGSSSLQSTLNEITGLGVGGNNGQSANRPF